MAQCDVGVDNNDFTPVSSKQVKKIIFEITTNLDSSDLVPHTSNGTFNIVTDDAIGSIIKGKYDHGGEMWSHDYVITDLTSTTMTWTALDNEFYIQHFRKAE